MFIRNLFLLAVGLAAAGAASAQSLGKQAEFYFEADANTVKPIAAVRESGDAAAQKLLRKIERDPQAKVELIQLAHLAMESNRHDLGRDLYARAFARIDRTDVLWRSAMWNYGWDLFHAGDATGALEQWRTLQAARNVTASWIPPTNALVLWTLGRKDEAVQWYAAAVRTEPQQWRTPAAYAELLPDWRDSERATLAEVQAAWAANPPTWP
ncbi:MAG TPA: tetratricopeptide repeat protein [Lysobacter sp.]|jgi:Tfp pilus assembly protein PilF|nr:tetratricopeptide repeat protein [Lysobacter sp.]